MRSQGGRRTCCWNISLAVNNLARLQTVTKIPEHESAVYQTTTTLSNRVELSFFSFTQIYKIHDKTIKFNTEPVRKTKAPGRHHMSNLICEALHIWAQLKTWNRWRIWKSRARQAGEMRHAHGIQSRYRPHLLADSRPPRVAGAARCQQAPRPGLLVQVF